MKQLSENCSSLSRLFFFERNSKHFMFIVSSFLLLSSKAQIANYVSNGSFEDFYDCSPPFYPINKVKSWLSIDSISFAGVYLSKCNNYVPKFGSRYQYPKLGNSHVMATFFNPNGIGRSYPKNRLKKNLIAGKTYCIRFYVNISDVSPEGMDGFGAYFGDGTIDTITKCTVPLTFLTPQVKNPLGNVITDTLNWVPITGTFTANGTEKYLVLGNFLADNSVTTITISGTSSERGTDVLIDAVSCIEVDVAAYAGPDKYLLAGDSVYIGRERDFAVDPYCVWFQLPNTTSLDTTSGIWVKPTQTTTYVVQQNLECGSLKWDTVVVRVGYTGVGELSDEWLELSVYPNPANDFIELEIKNYKLKISETQIYIYNNLGQLIREEELEFKEGKATLNTKDLENGVYVVRLISGSYGTVSKRIVIAR